MAFGLVSGLVLASATSPAQQQPTQIQSTQIQSTQPQSTQPELASTHLAQAQPAAAAVPSPATADAQPVADEPIGNVATLTGSANVIRNSASTPLKIQDDIFLNDVVQTSANSALGVTFNDATTFNLSANARITIDNYVYEDGGKQNAALFNVVKGTVAFAAAAVAKTGDMKISTPTATLGIRGTTGLIKVPQGAAGANPNNVAIKLYPDADGRVGRIDVNGRDGSRLGFLTQGASGFTIRPGAGPGARFAAVPLAISPAQAQRDRGIVGQVHAAQNVGRQIVSQQRALRQANPNRANPNRNNPPNGNTPRNNLRNDPAHQPGQRPGGRQQPGPQRQPAAQPQPGAPPQPGLQKQGVQQGAPGAQRPGIQRPGLQRPGLQNRPALPRRAAPKGRAPGRIR